MTWYLSPQGRSLICMETAVGIWIAKDGEWQYGSGKNFLPLEEWAAHAMLAALGHRWDGSAIVPLAAPAGLTLEPVDLSKPAEAGVYLVKVKGGDWYTWIHNSGGKLNADISHAYHLPENVP